MHHNSTSVLIKSLVVLFFNVKDYKNSKYT
jgi:hypothetical protein